MASDKNNLAREIISKDKWWEILSRFIDVLRVNIYIVDQYGMMILPPEESRYGGHFLSDPDYGFDLHQNTPGFIDRFEPMGKYFESKNRFHLYSFAIPINYNGNQLIGYLVVGPIILNKRLDKSEYEGLAQSYGVAHARYFDELSEIRVISNVMINSILDLLAEIVRDNIELSKRERELHRLRLDRQPLSEEFESVADEIYSTVHMDELLVTLLDVALKMTETECGSIMVADEGADELVMKVSRGVKQEGLDGVRSKIGEGIAGLAVKQNESFVIKGQQGDSRIQHLLKRDDIQHALVMPLTSQNRVFGVLNIHTKKDSDKIEENIDNLQYLTKLLSSAF